MNCPQCGVYNPEDREICWRCNKELPKPVEPPKKRDPRAKNQLLIWVAIAVFFVMMVLQMCRLHNTLVPPPAESPSGIKILSDYRI
ncbi:MAG: hypothetical protein GXY52_04115 [Chloroflexi bacterium]|nr:hypothetical protein [Chloroflexota bacterium]